MRGTRRWVRFAGIVALGAIALADGCHFFQRTGPAPERIELGVRNNSYFDVDVYVLQSSTGGAALRLGTVTGNSSTTLRVRPSDLQPGSILTLRLHAIGARGSWTTPSVTVGDGVTAMLEIYADPSGNLNRSTLFTMAPRDTSSIGQR